MSTTFGVRLPNWEYVDVAFQGNYWRYVRWLNELAPNAKEIDAPSHVPKDKRMNLDKLNKFLND
jgi:hypothetical protein